MHLKRHFAPRSWWIGRKEEKFIVRGRGGHRLGMGVPLKLVLREMLGYGRTGREVKKILESKEILVDGKRRKDEKFLVGIFDVVGIPEVKENYRMVMDKKGRLGLVKIEEKESKMKMGKVVGKKILRGGKVQVNLHDGRSILVDKQSKVGDSLVVLIPEGKVEGELKLEKGAFVYLVGGKRAGSYGVVEEVKGERIVYKRDKEKVETLKDYAIVIGKEKPLIKVEG